MKARTDLGSDEYFLPGSQTAIFSLCPRMMEGAWKFSALLT